MRKFRRRLMVKAIKRYVMEVIQGILIGVILSFAVLGIVCMVTLHDMREISVNESVANIENNYTYEQQMPQYLDSYCIDELEDIVWDMYWDKCTNHCEDCDCYYYEICDCEYACAECNEPVECDFKAFIIAERDMIMDLADEMLADLQQSYMDSMTDYELCEF
jgi:hypothetical protein